MKFESKKEYTLCENLLYTLYTAEGIGEILVKYVISPKRSKASYWVQIGDVALKSYDSTEEDVEKDAIALYREFTKNKISSRHVVVKDRGMLRIYDIKTGWSIALSHEAVMKLGVMF